MELVESEDYSYLIHNHPSEIPIPSLGDIYQLYKISNDGYLQEKCSFIIYSTKGTISFEIVEQSAFNAFIYSEMFSNGKYDNEKGKQYIRNFNRVLGVSKINELLNLSDSLLQSTINKAIEYFSKNKGLQVAFSKESPVSSNWKYYKIDSDTLKIENCLK